MPRFPSQTPLRAELTGAVQDYFRRSGQDPHGGARMVLKTAAIFTWVAASYASLLLWSQSWWTALPLCASLALALAAVGFSVMHDGGHGAYSEGRRVNRLAAACLDLIGGSSFVWHHKHNVLHHTYTNVEGADDDIEFHPFLRLSDGQPRYWFHAFQHLYWAPLLLFLATKWVFVDDFVALARGEVGGHPLPTPSARELAWLLSGKLIFAVWAVLIPLLLVSPLAYLAGYALVSGLLGLTLGVVFQLAHAVEGTSFFAPAPGGTLELPWAEHQLATTADFARRNRLLTWFVGGLNHQVEHHLFPRVGHRHYPALAEIVRQVCARHGIVPHDHPTVAGALLAHVRHLRRLGRRAASPAPLPIPCAALGRDLPPEIPGIHEGRAVSSR
ncbi:MAG: fatty acid desaturase [Planctomycetota bacterium]